MEMNTDEGQYSIGDQKFDTEEDFLVGYIKSSKTMMSNNPNGSEFWDFILKSGKLFKGRENHRCFFEIKNLSFRPQIQSCYFNNQKLLTESSFRGKYFEGWAFDELIPAEHSWCVIDGKVVDITWEMRDRKLKKNFSKKTAYFGVEIPIGIVRKQMLKTGIFESMLWRVWEDL